ncbi:MAG: cation:proton antiporter, partial [Anaerolineales bacterium]
LGLLATSGTLELLSTIGLIYLMFSAALEIDLAQSGKVRNKALVFGLLGFAIPQASGFLIGRILGLDIRASILLGSIYASHTLIAFPVLTRLDIASNEAVSTTVFATVFTDVASLLVLAVIVGAGDGQGSLAYVVQLVFLMVIYTLVIALGLPRIGKRFFQRFSGRNVEFQFVLVALFVAAVGAELIGMHAIVGAFIAGLAINATLPRHSPVSGRVLFVGESLFIPIFLIFTGMRTDPLAVLSNPLSLLTGVLLTAAVLSTKFAASWLTSKLFGFERDEMLTMWGLSQAQAAATLAALLVGVEAGILPSNVFDGAILMVLVTSITSPLLVERFGSGLQPATSGKEDRQDIFQRILVPIANPDTQELLIRLAAFMARGSDGQLIPVNVARKSGDEIRGLEHQDRLMEDLEQMAAELEVEVNPMKKVASSISEGLEMAALESRASAVLMGWQGETSFRQRIFGSVIDRVVWNTDLPVIVARVTVNINGLEEVKLVLTNHIVPRAEAVQMIGIATTLAKDLKLPLTILSGAVFRKMAEEAQSKAGSALKVELAPVSGDVVSQLTAEDKPGAGSLILIPSAGSSRRFRWTVEDIPFRLADSVEDSIVVVHFP